MTSCAKTHINNASHNQQNVMQQNQDTRIWHNNHNGAGFNKHKTIPSSTSSIHVFATFFCLIHCIARIKRLKNTHLLQPFQQWGPPAARVCAQWRKAWACQGQLVGHHALTDWSGDWGAPRSGGRTPEMGQEWKTGHGSDKNTWLEMFHFSPWALALSVCKGRVSTWGWHPFSD